ncbi:MAG: hypothetical protein ACI9CF_001695 [Candidatus Omnitrophota bacterium]|jgi:hypothetical protein
MNLEFREFILEATQAKGISAGQKIQDLWSGYGTIKRYGLKGSALKSVIVKHIALPEAKDHPRGWNTNLSHKRKLRSYEVEKTWYKHWSSLCGEEERIPKCLAIKSSKQESWLVLEDLNAVGFERRKSSLSVNQMSVCLEWLANFHALFLGKKADNLWKVGTYWHLKTRPDELQVLDDLELKNAATVIDQKLNNARYQTIVHGDAKLANFCFSPDIARVAAVDFQYVGGGCGMKDIAYFIGSCLDENQCQQNEKRLLDTYFNYLSKSVHLKNKDIDIDELILEWKSLYALAWTDFHRFIKGWSPGHWKINSYSEQLARKVLEAL